MLGAIAVCGLGYAEGAKLSRHLGGRHVISWALVLALPLMLAVSLLTCPASLAKAALNRMLGFERPNLVRRA
jgi:hypothetical protein